MISCQLLHGLEFRVVVLLDRLSPNVRESSLCCHLTQGKNRWIHSFFQRALVWKWMEQNKPDFEWWLTNSSFLANNCHAIYTSPYAKYILVVVYLAYMVMAVLFKNVQLIWLRQFTQEYSAYIVESILLRNTQHIRLRHFSSRMLSLYD